MNDKTLLPGQEDYWAGYQESIDKLRNDPETISFDQLCFEVFNSKEGKKLLEYFESNIVMGAVPSKIDNNFDKSCIYYEGYRQGFRQIIHAVKNYQLRKEAQQAKLVKDKEGVNQ